MALGLLAEVELARPRIDQQDPEGLHALRVAMRRLRSWLRAYEPVLEDSVGGKALRRLRDLADATSRSRDLEVHLAWLAAERARSRPLHRPGIDWLAARLSEQKAEADAKLLRILHRRFEPMRERLHGALSVYSAPVAPEGGGERWGTLAATLITRQLEELRDALAEITTAEDQEEAHEARIAGKRLRYLLEPLEGAVAGVAEVVLELKTLQDLLGDMHDAHVFTAEITRAAADAGAEEARNVGVEAPAPVAGRGAAGRRKPVPASPRTGLLALARRLRTREAAAFARLETEWLGGRIAEFADRMVPIVAQLDAAGDEAREIERKYLLRSFPERALEGEARQIDQGYLPGSRLIERLRRVRDSAGERFFRTVKTGVGISRTELEEETSRELFEAMWPFTAGRRLTKVRYVVPEGGQVWEVDRFTDRELVLAEVELRTVNERVELPEWLEAVVDQEVTGRPEYGNWSLAR